MTIKDPKFKIGQKVWHVTPESPMGIILNANYSLRYNEWTYTVSFSHDSEFDCIEDELSTNKTFA